MMGHSSSMLDLTAGFPEGNAHCFAQTNGKIHVTAIAENSVLKDILVLDKNKRASLPCRSAKLRSKSKRVRYPTNLMSTVVALLARIDRNTNHYKVQK
jgi:hypothetical protein